MVFLAESIKEVKGKVLAKYGNTVVSEGFPYYCYEISKPALAEKEAKLAQVLAMVLKREKPTEEVFALLGAGSRGAEKAKGKELVGKIQGFIESEHLLDGVASENKMGELKALMMFFLETSAKVSKPKEFVDFVADNTVGFFELEPLLRDDNLEEIMVNGWNRPLFVFHKDFGMCKTNVTIGGKDKILEITSKIANSVGKIFDSRHPLLDARLPDGNRVNATFQYATPFGPTLTIRKFRKEHMTIIDLIANNTLTAEVAGFLWVMVEGLGIEAMSILVVGGTSSGKTTTLNCLAHFMRYTDRIVTIEDTLELQLGERENWIQMEARLKSRELPEITMNDLLKNALRMRPDRILVGEVRDEAAQTMFVAMDIGHRGMMGTLHANNSKETITRLKNPPMSVQETMLPLIDLIIVQKVQYTNDKKVIRRVSQIAEVSRIENRVGLSNIFEWNRERDKVEKLDVPAAVIDKLSARTGLGKKEVMAEIKVRQKVVEWMALQKIRSQVDVERTIQQYYNNPNQILGQISTM